jgi:phosphoglycerate dehydrogenase-like enzyme
MKLLVAIRMNETRREELARRFPELTIVHCGDQKDRIIEEVHDADVVVGRLVREQFQRAKKLRFMQTINQGVNGLLYPELLKGPVLLANGKDIWSPAMAEHVLGLVLAFYRRLPEHWEWQREHRWVQQTGLTYPMLAGKTVAFLGTGSVAAFTVPLFAAFGCTIIGYNRRGREVPGFGRIYTGDGLGACVAEADVIVSALPLTPLTEGIVNEALIARMKPTAVFVNVGRGASVDESALVEALRERRILGAGLDVVAREPLAPDSPLWNLPNVIISGHCGGLGGDHDERIFQLILENLGRFVEGRPLLNLVDKEAGY